MAGLHLRPVDARRKTLRGRRKPSVGNIDFWTRPIDYFRVAHSRYTIRHGRPCLVLRKLPDSDFAHACASGCLDPSPIQSAIDNATSGTDGVIVHHRGLVEHNSHIARRQSTRSDAAIGEMCGRNKSEMRRGNPKPEAGVDGTPTKRPADAGREACAGRKRCPARVTW